RHVGPACLALVPRMARLTSVARCLDSRQAPLRERSLSQQEASQEGEEGQAVQARVGSRGERPPYAPTETPTRFRRLLEGTASLASACPYARARSFGTPVACLSTTPWP